MKDYTLAIEDGIVTSIELENAEAAESGMEVLPSPREMTGRLWIPREVTGFAPEVLIGCAPEAIEVEAGNPAFRAQGNCLLSRDGSTLVLACKNSVLPEDGSLVRIGDGAFNWALDLSELALDPLRLPASVRVIGRRGLALYSENAVHLLAPASVERVEVMALMMRSDDPRGCTVTFAGSPLLVPGVFGTRAEAADTEDESYAGLPPILFTHPDSLLVQAPAGSSVLVYCARYGLPAEAI